MENNRKGINIGILIKIVTLLLVIMFFVPLFAVSCSGQIFEFSAARLTTGYSYQGDKLVEPHPVCILLIILPVAVFAASFLIKNSKLLSLLSGASGIINIIMLASIISNAKNEAARNYMEFETRVGFYLSLLLNLVLIGLAVIEFAGITGKTPLLQDSGGAAASSRICTQCGTPLKAGDIFCGQCGNKYEEVTYTAARFCTNCGNQLKEGENFCTNCGCRIG
ncbi:MAG: zinc-ribbon domain-containing protein [Clostridiales bacterium]|nr:zinc-ribbon domain-containing protein [Clostridiales bacterium]